VCVLAVLVFYRTLGNPLSQDTKMDFFRMVPESTWAKLFYSLLGGTVNCLLDLLPAMVAAVLILRANPLTALCWLLFILSVDFYATNVGTFIDLVKGNEVIAKGDMVAGEKEFKKAKGGNRIAAYRAYLKKISDADPANIAFNFNGEIVTGIEAVEILNRMSGDIYNINGQKVSRTQRGVYIINGKKVIVK
jgi:hypothetical protein